MQVTTENGQLVIKVPLNPQPSLSSTGKSLIVASSGGTAKTSVVVQGKPVSVTFSAFIKAA